MAIRTRLAFERVNESISFQSTTAFAVMVSSFGCSAVRQPRFQVVVVLFVGVRQPRIQVAVRLLSIADNPECRLLLLAFYIILQSSRVCVYNNIKEKHPYPSNVSEVQVYYYSPLPPQFYFHPLTPSNLFHTSQNLLQNGKNTPTQSYSYIEGGKNFYVKKNTLQRVS